MTTLEEIQQRLRQEFARSGGLARAKALTKKRLKEIAAAAGRAPKKKGKK